MKKIKNISFGVILLAMMSLFMHSVIPHHHHEHEECEVYDINGFADIHSFDDCLHDDDSHDADSATHDDDHDATHDDDDDHHSYLNCHFHTDITVLSVLDFNFLLPEGIKVIAFKVENEIAYYLEPEIYNFSPEEHQFRRGPPTSFMG